jgi:DNA-binding CsgD family transcriptional regulator
VRSRVGPTAEEKLDKQLSFLRLWTAVRARACFDRLAYQQVLDSHAVPRPPTGRQLILLELVRRRLSNREIAECMGIAPSSVGNAIQTLKMRVRFDSRAQLAEHAEALRHSGGSKTPLRSEASAVVSLDEHRQTDAAAKRGDGSNET